jgi:APA family basic amino acid/polyamine antiporter
MYLLFSVGRPGAFALLNGLVLTSRVTAALTLIPLLGAKGAAWSLALSYAVGALFIGLFVLRWRRPELPRPYKVWGYPFTPLIFLFISLWMLIHLLADASTRTPSLLGLGTTLFALVIYFASPKTATAR